MTMERLKKDDKFTYCGREWTIVQVGEYSYQAKSPSLDGHAVGHFSFQAVEQEQADQELRSGR